MAQINKPNEYFNPVTYTGNGTTQSITGVNFQPDFVWVKSRNFAEDHQLTDSVRGATKVLQSNLTNAESTMTGGLTSFDTDGFSVGNQSDFNFNNDALISWNWKAGGTAVSNTDGSITSSVSASTTSGFSVVTFTGTGSNATVGHGLGSVPKMIILKGYSNAPGWYVYTQATGNQTYLRLNTNDATGTPDSAYWNSTTPTSSVFSIGVGGDVNGSGQTMVAYCFADVKGFSKVGGSYVGNGSADGTFVYTGFKPAWLMVKRSSTSGTDWYMFDNKRNTFNVTNSYLDANTSDAEVSNISFDFTSNGFKLRDSQTIVNGSGSTFIYMAFAENPLVGTNNVPATAR